MRLALGAAAALAALFGAPLAADPLQEAAPRHATPEHGLFTAVIVTPSAIVAAGERGLIVRGTPNAWQQAAVPVRRMLTALVAAGDGRLLAVGHDALILESADGGATWSVVHSQAGLNVPLLDAWIGRDGRGLAVGAHGLALATADYGRSWTRREIDPGEPHFYAVREAADGALFVIGEFGTVLRSRDHGRSWTRLDTGYAGSFFNLRVGPDGRLLLHGLRGRLYQSDDGGDLWRRRETGVAATLYDVVFDGQGRAIVVGAGGTILRETPGRDGFRHVPWRKRGAIMAAALLDSEVLLVFGENGIGRVDLNAGRS